MNKLRSVTFLAVLLLFYSCDTGGNSKDAALVLTSIELTSSSHRSATTVVYEEDDVYVDVNFTDSDETAENLYMTVTSSGGVLVISQEIGNFAIHDGSVWKTNFSTSAMALDTYTIETYATNISDEASNSLSSDFTIEVDLRDSVVDGNLFVVLDGTTPYEAADENLPFRINFWVQNNSPVLIDLIQVEFEIMDGVITLGKTFGVVECLAVDENRSAVANANIPAAMDLTGVTIDIDPDYLIEFY